MNDKESLLFEWDETKNLGNIEARGLDFHEATLLFDGRFIVTTMSFRNDEVRFLSVGEIGVHVFTVVWTFRDEKIRIISFRRAGDGEERTYRELRSEGD